MLELKGNHKQLIYIFCYSKEIYKKKNNIVNL